MTHTYPVTNRPKPFWIELVITLMGVAGITIFMLYYERALPNAAIDLTYSRDEISRKAEEYLQGFGFSPNGYQFALSFEQDSRASIYLQRKLGVEETNIRLSSENWPLYYWSARWFKPLEKEEFSVYLSPQGELLGFVHIVTENANGVAIELDQAQVIAEAFLSQYPNWNPSDWEQIEASSVTSMPGGRVDHTFAWKSQRFSAGESELRYLVEVQGDQVGYFNYWIKIPESFERSFASERNRAGFINTIVLFIGMFGFLMVAIVGVFIGKPDRRRAMWPALLAAAVSLAAALNLIPLYRSYYDTTQDYTLFWVMAIIGVLANTAFNSMLVYLAWAGGQSISKYVWPRQDRILARGPNRVIEFSRSAWRGLMLGLFDLGYVVLFYMVTTQLLGWWAPVTAEYSDAYATPFPFLLAFNIGLNAALSEELLFRLIGIGFFLWIFRKQRWLAVLIPGMLWAFAHTSYVAYPIYTRGIELIINAIIAGIIFLKFDLFTTIMAHFTYNMLITATPLLRSDDPHFHFSGMVVLAVLALPLLPGLFWVLRLRFTKSYSLPESFTISPASTGDLEKLDALPVKADWPALLQRPNRLTLCLRGHDELIGFATGYIQDNLATIDGIYVSPRWRRQYWGATLLDAIQEKFKSQNVEKLRSLVLPAEGKPMAFLHNLFWRHSVYVLTPKESPTFASTLKSVKNKLREKWQNWKTPTERGKLQEKVLEIPRDIL